MGRDSRGEPFVAKVRQPANAPPPRRLNPVWVWTWFVFALIVLAAWLFILWGPAELRGKTLAIALGITLVYLVLGYCVHIEADILTDDGLAGGMVNTPFMFADNINRIKITLNFLLAPGRFLVESLVGPMIMNNQDEQWTAKQTARRREADLDAQMKLFLSPRKPEEQRPD